MVLFLHNRYRSPGGEERAVDDLLWLVREQLGEEAELLERDSALLGRARAAAGLLRGGLRPDEVARAVRRTGARVVHAHNLDPAFGWRALAAARGAGARVVVHLHQYRLVCAVGICFTAGRECTRCHGRNTLPGRAAQLPRLAAAEALVYAAALALWQRRLDRPAATPRSCPSEFARAAPARARRAAAAATHVLPHPVRRVRGALERERGKRARCSPAGSSPRRGSASRSRPAGVAGDRRSSSPARAPSARATRAAPA